MCKYGKTSLFVIVFFAVSFFIYYHHFLGHSISLHKTAFKTLSRWEQEDHSAALLAFKKSCVDILKRNPGTAFSHLAQSKINQDWQAICLAANQLSSPNKRVAQQFFETWFIPYAVKDNFNPNGLFTGYYLPVLKGSLKKSKHYSVPIYGLPADLVKVDLSLFNAEWANRMIVGQLQKNKLVPYPDRAAINNGILGNDVPVLAWSDSAVDVFFAQIQGSALVQLPHHRQLVIGYASSNGRSYTSLGKLLIAHKVMDEKNISMQAIRTWLSQHPEQVTDLLNQNASYVFFMLRPEGPVGTEQVPLTAQHSLAVDTHYIPLGAPMWLETKIPTPQGEEIKYKPYHQLLIAQDTGGAIKGIIRGDIYCGGGEEAAFLAGHMKQRGRYWILLPK